MKRARSSPVRPSLSASLSPHAVTQISTASACLRRLSLWVHSVSSCHACSRPYRLSGFTAAVMFWIVCVAHLGSRFFGLLRDSCGYLRVDPKFLLDNYGSPAESSTYRGAKHPGVPSSGTPRITQWLPLLSAWRHAKSCVAISAVWCSTEHRTHFAGNVEGLSILRSRHP